MKYPWRILIWNRLVTNHNSGHVWCVLHMMTSSNGSIFRVTGDLCGEFTDPRWIPKQLPVTRNCDVYFDLRLNRLLCKQSWGWSIETLSLSLWRHCNGNYMIWCNIEIKSRNKHFHKHIPQCTCLLTHNSPFKRDMCTFLFCMGYWRMGYVHCGICEIGLLHDPYLSRWMYYLWRS